MPVRIKPRKPWPQFPLTPHPSGTWCKKIKGKLHHFGPWSDPDGALARWEAEASHLRSGATKTDKAADAQTLRMLANRWLVEKLKDAESGGITWGHYSQCRRAVRLLLKHVGEDKRVGELAPDDFRAFGRVLEQKFGTRALRRCVRTIIGLFNYAADEDWLDRPVKLGKRFKALRNKRDDTAPRDKSRPPADIMRVIEAAEKRLRALEAQGERSLSPMRQLIAAIWLGVNGGYGSTDLAELPRAVVDLDGASIDYRRGKTGQERIVPLMPETVEALRAVLAERPDDELVFRTREGHPWRREVPKHDKRGQVTSTTLHDNFQAMYGKLLKLPDVKMKRPGCGFYELRHCHAELADAAGDPHAAARIMGHALPGSRNAYVRVTPERLRAVVDHVRGEVTRHRSSPGRRRGGATSGSGSHAVLT